MQRRPPSAVYPVPVSSDACFAEYQICLAIYNDEEAFALGFLDQAQEALAVEPTSRCLKFALIQNLRSLIPRLIEVSHIHPTMLPLAAMYGRQDWMDAIHARMDTSGEGMTQVFMALHEVLGDETEDRFLHMLPWADLSQTADVHTLLARTLWLKRMEGIKRLLPHVDLAAMATHLFAHGARWPASQVALSPEDIECQAFTCLDRLSEYASANLQRAWLARYGSERLPLTTHCVLVLDRQDELQNRPPTKQDSLKRPRI